MTAPTRRELARSTTCTRLGCDAKATKSLQQSIGGRPWLACEEHTGVMTDALYVGMPGASSGGSTVQVTKL